MTNLTSDGIAFESSSYIAMHLQLILYGVELFLYFKVMGLLMTNRRTRKKSELFYGLFSSIMLCFVTIWVTTQAVFDGRMWLFACYSQDGPNTCWETTSTSWYMTMASFAMIMLQLMADALMIHRCRIIWNSYRVVIIPMILWVATLGLACLLGWATDSPGGNFFAGFAIDVGLSYYAVAILLNATVTCMICYRVVRHGKQVQAGIGREYGSLYLSIATLIVESVLPYTLSGIAFVVSYGMGSPTSVAFVFVYGMMMCISPQILILRVIGGRAWDTDTFKPPGSTIKFDPGRTFESQRIGSTGVGVHLEPVSNVYPPDGDV